jgi:DNA polymerase (family 10)
MPFLKCPYKKASGKVTKKSPGKRGLKAKIYRTEAQQSHLSIPYICLMNNKEIAGIFSLLAKLMELHGENSFKTKAYSGAAFRIEKLPQPLESSDLDTLSVPGIGAAIAEKIRVLLTTGSLPLLEAYLAKTPAGVMDMLSIKGIGPKKIALLWQELGIESIGELAYACQENRLISLKGFGAKTQESILKNIAFIQNNKGYFLYATIEAFANQTLEELKQQFPSHRVFITGDFRRQMPFLKTLSFVTDISETDLIARFSALAHTKLHSEPGLLRVQTEAAPELGFHLTESRQVLSELFKTTAAPAFAKAFLEQYTLPVEVKEEAEIFSSNGLQYVPPALRESEEGLRLAEIHQVPEVIRPSDIKGIIHCHSTYSDGLNSLEEMSLGAIERGYEYLVISDHSQIAVYANGLSTDRIRQQHAEIAALNQRLAPFRIFKSIESDILNDGRLDYEDEILASFDLVIASVHSNLKMPEEKAMERLLRAIENPFTTILGHPTGRLLLSREGYPIDHKKIIEACAANKVVIEINAHPRRLDLDWSWIPYALEKGVLLSVDPDAHSVAGMDLIKYGVLSAQKGGLTAAQNLSSKSREELELFLKK